MVVTGPIGVVVTLIDLATQRLLHRQHKLVEPTLLREKELVTILVRSISLLTHLNVTRHVNGLSQAQLITLGAVHGQNSIVADIGCLLYA